MHSATFEPNNAYRGGRPRGHALFDFFERCFVVVACVGYGSLAFRMLLGSSSGPLDPASDPLVARILFMLLYIITTCLLALSPSIVRRTVLCSPLLVVVILLPVASIVWSVDKSATFVRATSLLGSSLFGIYLAYRFSLTEVLRLLAIAYTIIMTTSLLTVLFLPSVGVTSSTVWSGTWRGLYEHKNGLGAAAAASAIIQLFAMSCCTRYYRLLFVGGLFVSLVLLAGASSLTALLSFLVILTVLMWTRIYSRLPHQVGVLSLVLLVALALLVPQIVSMDIISNLLGSVGKNSGMSGRFPLWELSWNVIAQKFWLGYGYNAFWELNMPEVKVINYILHYTPYYSHNGILETLLNGGIVLLSAFLALYVVTLMKSFAFLNVNRAYMYGGFPLTFMVCFSLYNISESKILFRDDLLWIIFVMIVCMLNAKVKIRVIEQRRTLAGRSTLQPKRA